MNKLYLMALLLLCTQAKGQYFHHLYGGNDNEFLRSGVNTVVQGQGHFMAGTGRLTCLQPVSTLPVAFTDVNGDVAAVGAPYFEKNIILSRPNAQALHVSSAQAFEMDNGSGFGVIGSYIDFASSTSGTVGGIFYVQLDPTGNVINVFDYTIVNTNYVTYQVSGLAETTVTSAGTEVYVTGGTSDMSNLSSYVLKLDVNTGAVIWGQVYDIYPNSAGPNTSYEAGRGIVESPYAPFGPNEVAVVGQAIDYTSTGTSDGFLLHLDASNGNVLNTAWIYGVPTRDDAFNSIRISNNTNVGPAGFVIGGISSFDHWVLRTDPQGNVTWSTVFDYSQVAGSFNECNDVIERFNTSGRWEYYAVGSTDNGFFGGMDVMVVKVDEAGNGFGMGEFIYGGANGDMGVMADQYNVAGTAPPDGLSIYATSWNGMTADMYLIKGYFNGASGCNERFFNPSQNSGPGLISNPSLTSAESFTQSNLSSSYVPFTDVALCYNPNLATGNNARVEPKKTGDVDMKLAPNPVEQSHPNVTLQVESDLVTEAEITVIDMLGKQYYKGKVSLAKGKNDLSVEIRTPMATGIYNVVIKTGDTVKTQHLLVK